MSHPPWDHLDTFLDTDDFAVIAELSSETSERVHTCPIIFDAPYMEADLGDYRMNAPGPSFTCKQIDVVAFKKHDTAVIEGQRYRLTHDPQPDGTGLSLVRLALVASP